MSFLSSRRIEEAALRTGSDFLHLIGCGWRGDQRRVYTYSITDSGMRFSETGVHLSKDFASKHAVHANGEDVRCAGTFRVCENLDGAPILVIDNDSGTYRPKSSHLCLAQELLEDNFPGLCILRLSVSDPQPEDSLALHGPCEERGHPRAAYKGQWRWRQ